MPGLNVMVFHDFYPEGHQGGLSIIQNGVRVATNGDIRLEPTPGQWQPIPKTGQRKTDVENQQVSVSCSFPDPKRDRKGFNPIIYPDLQFNYEVNVRAEGAALRIIVDLETPLPAEWIGRVGFNLELFPGAYFDKTYILDDFTGIFPRQLNGPKLKDSQNNYEIEPMAEGRTLVVAPESDALRMVIISNNGHLQLLDGRAHHNNGWFVVRSCVPAGATKGAVEWIIEPNVLPNWQYQPVIQISQIGYHPNQEKIAIIECDAQHKVNDEIKLQQILPSGEKKVILSAKPEPWGKFTRYQYLRFDFSEIKIPGLYIISYEKSQSNPFQIKPDIFDRQIWQPTLEYFLPVQMCHMRVNDRYRIWHGLCHMDDALMAPIDTLHFDGYQQGSSTLTNFAPLEHVLGLNVGGWHDAGDYDLRVESQMGTVRILSQIYENFKIDYDETTIDQEHHLVEMHQPDGQPDVLQQIEHGVLSVLGGYKALGRLYRGIICSDLRQYVMLGDGSTMTDNVNYDQKDKAAKMDDRWVFTEENPRREMGVAAGLAVAARVLKNYDANLAKECLEVAEAIYQANQAVEGRQAALKIDVLAELIITTDKDEYKQEILTLLPEIGRSFRWTGVALGRLMPVLKNSEFDSVLNEAAQKYSERLKDELQNNPYGIPFRPNIWGVGWNIQQFGVQQYFLHQTWPALFPLENMMNALHYVLGRHPGENTASFVSGVGAKSVLVAYGVNRADWSFIPGGSVSGTGFIRPDFPELKEWPFFWQQTEYVMGGGATNFMFLALAAQHVLK